MANSFGFVFNGTQIGITLNASVATLRPILRRFLRAKGVDEAALDDTDAAKEVLRQVAKIVADISLDQQRREETAEFVADLEPTLSSDNQFTEPAP